MWKSECGKARLDARPREGAGGQVFGNPAASLPPAGSSPARRSPCGFRPGAPSSGTRRAPPGCALAVFADSTRVESARLWKKPLSRGVLPATGAAAEFAGVDFALPSPAGSRGRARRAARRAFEAGLFSGVKGKIIKTRTAPNASPNAVRRSVCRRRGARDATRTADPRPSPTGGSISARRGEPAVTRKPDRFPMTAPTAKDLRRLTKARLETEARRGRVLFRVADSVRPVDAPPARRFAYRRAHGGRKRSEK